MNGNSVGDAVRLLNGTNEHERPYYALLGWAAQMSDRDNFEYWVLHEAPLPVHDRRIKKGRDGEYLSAALKLAWGAWEASRTYLSSGKPADLWHPEQDGWARFADGRYGCDQCGSYVNMSTGKVAHKPGCERNT